MLAKLQTIHEFSTAIDLMRLGTSALSLGFFLTFILAVLAGISMWRKDERLAHAARRGQYAMLLVTAFCCALLYVGIFNGYYFVGYIRHVTENNETFGFKVAALWASQQGSLLFWCFILTLFSAFFAFTQRHNRTDRRMPAILLVLSVVQFFFFFIMVSPFDAEAAQRSSPFAIEYQWLLDPKFAAMTCGDFVGKLQQGATFSGIPISAGDWVEQLMAADVSKLTLGNLHTLLMSDPAKLPPAMQAALLESVSDGNGMNPQLHNYWVAIHPPMLYLGFVGFTIPFAWAVGSLISGEVSEGWLRPIRLWAMGAWGFLTVGIALGGLWAYEILGWGGYWAWDPVENASFIPWLTGTAFIHSVIVTERRGILRVWSFALVIITYCMTVIGTFLVRSGIINSVHAFGATGDVDMWFYGFLGIVFIGSLLALVWRLPLLKSDRQLDSLVSREGAFLFNNLIFLAIALVTLLITFWPWITEKLMGKGGIQEFGQDAFVMINVPLFLLVLVLMGVGPALAWRQNSLREAMRALVLPAIAGMVTGIVNAIWLSSAGLVEPRGGGGGVPGAANAVRQMVQLTLWPICVFTFTCIFIEFWNSGRARARNTKEPLLLAIVRVTLANRRRFGGYIVHLGVLLVALGIYYSSLYEGEGTITAKPGGFGVIENRLTGEKFVAYYAGETRTASWDFLQSAFGDEEKAQLYRNMMRHVRANPDKDAGQIVEIVKAEMEKTKAQAIAMSGGVEPPFIKEMEQALPRMTAAIHWGVSQRDNTRVYESFDTTVYVFPVRDEAAPDATKFIEIHDRVVTRMTAGTDADALRELRDELYAEGIKLGIHLHATLDTRRNAIGALPDDQFAAIFSLDRSNASVFATMRHQAMEELGAVHEMIESDVAEARNARVLELAGRIEQPESWSQLVALSPLSLVGLMKAHETASGDRQQSIARAIDEIKRRSIVLHPRMRIFYDKRSGAPRMNEPVKDPYYSRSASRDLYFILQDATLDGRASLRFFIKPHMTLGLCGLLVLIGGTVLAILPTFRKRRAEA